MFRPIKKFIFSLFLFSVIFFPALFVTLLVNAASSSPSLDLQVPLMGYTKASNFAEYLGKIYETSLYIIVPLIIAAILLAGAMWATARGDSGVIKQAKERIVYGFIGLFLALTSYVILSLVGLTRLSMPLVDYVEAVALPDMSDYVELQFQLQQNSGEQPKEFEAKSGPANVKTVEIETLSGNKKVQVDEAIVTEIQKTFKELKAAGFNVQAVGGYRVSKMCHGKALAIDINVPQNYCIDCYNTRGAKVGDFYRPEGPGGSGDYTVDKLSLTQQAVTILKNNGWCWGGDWKSFKDYMHFSLKCSSPGTGECAKKCPYDFSKSVKQNHATCGNTIP